MMRRVFLSIVFTAMYASGVAAQQSPQAQTARQALLEMFFSKTPGTFVKHLPEATRAALENAGAMAGLQQYSMITSQLQSQGHSLQTFETGSVLLTGEDQKTGQKVEVTVEKDALRGDQDDIELSFQTYKDGQPQRTPFMPRITFSMKQEAKIWKLNELAVTIRLPLADPDLLKALTEKMKPQVTATSTGVQQGGSVKHFHVCAAEFYAACRQRRDGDGGDANDSHRRDHLRCDISECRLQLHPVGPGWLR